MQTFERTEDHAVAELVPVGRKRRPFAAVIGAVVLVALTSMVVYAVASPHTVTKTKTVVVTKATPTTLAPVCAPGAAPGSCNVDEEREALIPDRPLSAATRAEVGAQLVAARAAALKYPTVAAAVAGGFIPAGKFSPETGAHYIRINAFGTFDPSSPPSLIYDGTTPTSVVIGAMYLGGAATAPDGFAGPNDHWHRHSNTCVIFDGPKIAVPFAADSDVTAAQCSAQHGTFMPRTTWMVHAWVVPGWESPLGVFSHNNPDVKCANGSEHTDAVGFCKGPGDV
jgi:hypothetical protein